MTWFWVSIAIFGITLGLVAWLASYEGITKPDPECEHHPRFDRAFADWYCTKCGKTLSEDERLRSANAREHDVRELWRRIREI